ncbi:IDEAL domain-containing protein [Alkalihalobacterium sp. APHAB7]
MYQIDYALKERNKHLFYQLTKKLNSLDYTNSMSWYWGMVRLNRNA